MLKQKADVLVEEIEKTKDQMECCLGDYLNDYADYGMDNIANNMIGVIALLEQIRCELQYAMVEER